LKTARGQHSVRPAPPRLPGRGHSRLAATSRAAAAKSGELAGLRTRLAEAEETLRAIRTGEVDAVVIAGKQGPRVFTLQGAEHAYRVLIESMNEGALTLAADRTILYANQTFARMVKCPLEQVTGSSFRRFLSDADRAALQRLLKRANRSGAKIPVKLTAGDGSQMPVQISIRPLPTNGPNHATIGLVVTDLTEARQNEQMLRALSHRLVQTQEAERGRVALGLHDNITQLLCAILFRSQALAERLSARDGPAKREAIKLRAMLGKAAEEVERISRGLRPSVLDQLGLVAALRHTSQEFEKRTGVPVKLTFAPLTVRMPSDAELALYRILQETLKNVERHARARHVAVSLRQQGAVALLAITDDGVGFDRNRHPAGRKETSGLGLLGMHERAAYVGGAFLVRSVHRSGTSVEVRIPLLPGAAAA